jgi:hypothetical protein
MCQRILVSRYVIGEAKRSAFIIEQSTAVLLAFSAVHCAPVCFIRHPVNCFYAASIHPLPIS